VRPTPLVTCRLQLIICKNGQARARAGHGLQLVHAAEQHLATVAHAGADRGEVADVDAADTQAGPVHVGEARDGVHELQECCRSVAGGAAAAAGSTACKCSNQHSRPSHGASRRCHSPALSSLTAGHSCGSSTAWAHSPRPQSRRVAAPHWACAGTLRPAGMSLQGSSNNSSRASQER
jgi:hypothetical protein